jgi:dephospho-CoA kinase
MRLIGLTGGIGMGKSTVAEYLIRSGEKVIDSDLLARRMVEPGQPALEEIRRAFGDAVISSEGQLDRKALASAVFSDDESRRRLETILHPRIRAAWRRQVELWRAAGESRATVVIPLLYETGADAEVDQVLCVSCTPETQRARLRTRGWDDEEIARRNAAQLPIEKKMDRADGVIWNESSIEICEEQCRRWLENE